MKKNRTKAVSTLIPILGQIVAPSVSVAMLEAAGWAIAYELEAKARK